jgi:Hemolysin-type calcium-binding repeat (2 copies).
MATVTGTVGDDDISVTPGEATNGADSITTFAGKDTIESGSGDDTIDSGSGQDNISSGADDDSVRAGADVDYIDGGGGNDTIDGGAGADFMIGNFGNDTYIVDNIGDSITEYSAQDGVDTVRSSVSYTLGQYLEHLSLTGTNAINGAGNSLANSIFGNGAANRLQGFQSNDTLNGNAGNDTLEGGGGADSLVGGLGNDSLVGIVGTDTLRGGAGNDTLSGGLSADTFAFDTLTNGVIENDLITDYSKAEGDRIDLPNGGASIASFAVIAGGVRLNLVGGDIIRVLGASSDGDAIITDDILIV